MWEYKMLDCPDEIDLSRVVNKFLAGGWDLWGNPFAYVFPSSDVVRFCQAVVRTVDIPQTEEIASPLAAARNDTEPAGYTVQVPILEEMAPREQEAHGPYVTPEIPIGFTHDGDSGTPVQCACFEKIGDNPECGIHRGMKFEIVESIAPLLIANPLRIFEALQEKMARNVELTAERWAEAAGKPSGIVS